MSPALLAEFETAEACGRAISSLRERGAVGLEVYMPYAASAITEALEVRPSPLPRIVFVAGVAGACLGYFVLWYTTVVSYPLNVGGRPSHAVPAFIPITFETLVLFAGCTAFLGALVLGGLPRLYHPLDAFDGFRRVSNDRFVITVDAEDGSLDEAEARASLESQGALRVIQLPESARKQSAPPSKEAT